MHLENEAELIQMAQTDPRAFDIIYEHYFPYIYRYAYYHTLHKQDAEDVVSQTFLQAMENLSSFKHKGIPFGYWLYRVAGNILYHKHRLNRKDPAQGNLIPLVDNAIDHEALNLLIMMRSLPAGQRQVLELRYIQDLPIKDVAQIMTCSEGAVKQLSHRAIQNLKKRGESCDV